MNEEYLISYLERYNGRSFDLKDDREKIRALMNITMPENLDDVFYHKQDEYLKAINDRRKYCKANELVYENGIALIKGDITEIECDAIVNACNSQLLGCFVPLHKCIDNTIHSFAGLQVRRDLMSVMKKQDYYEPNGRVKVTSGYNLKARYIFHTVGPVYRGTNKDRLELRSCYQSCLNEAEKMGIKTIAFPSISTGIFAYPIEEAAKIAVDIVKEEIRDKDIKVIFVMFTENDREIYERYLSADQ